MLAGPGVKLIEWPKEAFAEFEDAHVEIRIDVQPDETRVVSVEW